MPGVEGVVEGGLFVGWLKDAGGGVTVLVGGAQGAGGGAAAAAWFALNALGNGELLGALLEVVLFLLNGLVGAGDTAGGAGGVGAGGGA